MKLSEMKTKPTHAGKAVLRFSDDVLYPSRRGKVITLSNLTGGEFFPLQRGRQFLFRCEAPVGMSVHRTFWFGGTDDSPFLVELDKRVFDEIKKKGTRGFFRAVRRMSGAGGGD